MSAVLCLPACLCVSTAASRGQAPHGNASVAYAQGSIAQKFGMCSSGVVGDMQHTAFPMLANFAFCAALCFFARPSPRSTARSQLDTKRSPDVQGQTYYLGTSIEAWLGKITQKINPGLSPKTADFAKFRVLTPHGDPLTPGR